jgi:transcriptional regulator
MAVHVYGKPEIILGEALYNSLGKLMDKYEQGSENPLSIHALPPTLVEKMMPAIVGFKMKAETIQASFKLSQNRNSEDYHNIIEALKKRTDAASQEVANAMERKM